ncbi:hypothetical protein [Georgenia deserti]|uniref:ARB-07466-like C-terminal domain-containing protein n=1 Tax=Georgenia deserti TaxID=2093781 RepID=A0ABW4L2W6_9MICO
MDPYQATVLFYERLTAVQDWQRLPPTIAGHRAQRNADPLHYQEHWSPTIEVVGALAAQTGRPGLDDESQLNLGPVKPHTQALADEVAARFDLDPADVGGYRDSALDSGGHPAGLAVDFMTYEDRELGDRIVDYLVEHADRLSVDYIIWRQAICSADPDAGWQPMEDCGDDTANHYDHPHVNVLPSPSAASPVGGMGCLLASGGEWVQPADAPITSRYGPRWAPSTPGSTSACRAGRRSTPPPAAS